MRVKAIKDSVLGAPPEFVQAGWHEGGRTEITIGKEYIVHGIVFWGHEIYDKYIDERKRPKILRFHIISDYDENIYGFDRGKKWLPDDKWLPSFLFEVVETSIPADWKCYFSPTGNIVLGPDFISKSEESYYAMECHEQYTRQNFAIVAQYMKMINEK